MSGFVAVVNLDGAPIEPLLARELTDALSDRGPDSREIWLGASVGLGHALLQTKNDGDERQPCTIDDRIWISGDIRVDGRAELVRALRLEETSGRKRATDPELILHAYAKWGEGLLDHLIGDFSFALWDSATNRLFCARDHMGVKPFFYARPQNRLIVSNTLSCIRAHRAVPTGLNEASVADFLLAGFNSDPAATMFKAIQRLPAGHFLRWSPGREPMVQRYWSLPRYDLAQTDGSRDQAEIFRTVLEQAVSDRLRTDRVSIQMSGGLDSTLIAAIAQRSPGHDGAPPDVRAHTVVYDKLFEDPERQFAALAAEALGLPIQYLAADDFGLLDARIGPSKRFPEPQESHSRPRLLDSLHQQIATHSRVALAGWDGDAILNSSWSAQLREQLQLGRPGAFIADALRYARVKRGLVRAFTRRLTPRKVTQNVPVEYPRWLNPDFERRLDLRARWSRLRGLPQPMVRDTSRSPAYEVMAHPIWNPLLEGYDPGTTGFRVDYRHPLLDLRVLSCALSLPAIPWCVDKHVMRMVGQPLLPQAIVRRRKTALQGDPVPFAIREFLAHNPKAFVLHPQMPEFVVPARTPEMIDGLLSDAYSLGLRTLILNQWLFAQ